jgi:glucose-6-phosphate-specific signal transduction histidine kinase
MNMYRKRLRQLRRARRLLDAQRQLLHELRDEGLTHLTLHTATRTLVLPVEAVEVEAFLTASYEALSNRRKQLKAEAKQERANLLQWEQAKHEGKP